MNNTICKLVTEGETIELNKINTIYKKYIILILNILEV